MKHHLIKPTLIFLLSIFFTSSFAQTQTFIQQDSIWPDTDGNHIQAHGGGIIKLEDVYYWYGANLAKGLEPNFRYVSCYTSKDLMNWKFNGNVLKMAAPDSLSSKSWVLERPKVYYNQTTNKYVMYFHIDTVYTLAQVGVAVSDSPFGPFKYVKRFRPLGHESRDIGQFIDDDGKAYLIFEDRPFGFRIAQLSDDYMDVEKEVCLVQMRLEAGCLVKYDGLYYIIASGLKGWNPNPNKYATATSLAGPWSKFMDIAPPETNTYGSQSTMLVKVVGSKTTTVLYLGDVWKSKSLWDSRYKWMPLEIGNGKLWLPTPRPFKIDVNTGEYSIVVNQNTKNKETMSDLEISVFPSLVKDYYLLKIKDIDQQYEYKLHDTNGVLLHYNKIKETETQIHIKSPLTSLLTVWKDSKLVKSFKIIKT